MKLIYVTAPLTLAMSAGAAPLMTTSASVATSGFCQVHGCLLTHREVAAPNLPAGVVYSYRLRGGGHLTVWRNTEQMISSAALSGVSFTSALARDFTRAFLGLTFEPSSVNTCIKQATAQGHPMFSGKMNGTDVILSCERDGKGRAYWSVYTMQTFGP